MKKLSLALALALSAVGSQAALTTNMGGSKLTSFGVMELPATGAAQSGFLDLFDTNTGTLTGATLFLESDMTTFITANAVTASIFKTATFVEVRFSSDLAGLAGILGTHSIGDAAEMILTNGPAGNQILAAGQSVRYPAAGTYSDSELIPYDLSGILGQLGAAGGGTFGISCSAFAGLTSTILGGNVGLDQTTDAGCNARIAYTFSPAASVPEPTSLALVGLALAGVGFAGAKRRKA